MELNIIIDYLIISIIASMAINNVLRNIAQHNSVLIDLPDRSRKFHKRATPLTGGISILLAILITGRIYIDFNDLIGYVPLFTYHLVLSSIMLVFSFLLDDIYKLKPLIRILIQCFLALYVIISTDVTIGTLGNLFGLGEINLGILDIPFTIFCVVGLMNAFNMIDGLNGICASLALLPLAFVAYFGNFSYGLLIPIGAIIGFLAYNLGYLGKKRGVFLGDSGSNVLGFAVAFICIEYSQNINHNSYINPVTALWLVAIPLLDCITVFTSRLLKGIMPFRPGRDHLHHKLLDIGIKPKKILYIFISISVFLSLIGLFLENNFPDKEYISFYAFVVLSVSYYLLSKVKLEQNV